MKLRDGSTTSDPRLDRLPQFDERDIAWLAGLLEGEAWFGLSVNRRATNGACAIRLRMTDKDIVQRVHQKFGGSFSGPTRPEGNRQPQWGWALYAREDLLPLLRAILPYMGVRRAERIGAMIARLEQGDGRTSPFPHGTLAGYNRHWYHGEKPCPACREASRKHSQERRASKR